MCAGILTIEGFTAVDPQHPLGGPDGIKDVVCRRGITKFVAAAYFPTTHQTFASIKAKFQNDLTGVPKNSVRGIVFFTNQPLTISERLELTALAKNDAESIELYHLERLRSVLDSPVGCGLRLEYLRIAMTSEEQIAFWSSSNLDVGAHLDRIENLQVKILHQIAADTEILLNRTTAMAFDLKGGPSSTSIPGLTEERHAGAAPATADIDVPQLLWLHRLVMNSSEYPPSLIGALRSIHVTIESSDQRTGLYIPPAPEDIPSLISDWCTQWREGYNHILAQDPDSRLDEICTAYYKFLQIHPFTDGNGRMGRVLLDQMFRELLGRSLSSSFIDARLDHQEALLHANNGDLNPLRAVLAAAIA